MTTETPYSPAAFDDTIDLRPYFLALFRWWPILAGLTALAVLLGGLATAAGSPMYEAKVAVAILSYKTEFSLESSLETAADLGAQRKALVRLARDVAVADDVVSALGDRLPGEYRDVATLLASVTATNQDGDLIDITVRATDPEVSVLVAQAWAAAYERHIDVVYGVGAYAIEALAAQRDLAKAEYDTAQRALVERTSTDPIPALERALREKQAALDAHWDARTASLEEYLQRRVALQRLHQNAASLLSVAREGGAASTETSALAIALLKSQAFAFSVLPENLTLQMTAAQTGLTAQAQVADLQALMGALQDEITATDQAIAEVSMPRAGTPVGNHTELLASLEEEVRGLEGQLAEAKGEFRELERARDLAWETYSAVTRKIAEQRVESEVSKDMVRVASAPLLPTRRAGRPLVQVLAIAAAVGLTLGILGVLLVTYLWPEWDPRSLWRRGRQRESAG